MLTARTDPFLIDDPAGVDRTVRSVARPLLVLAPADRPARLGLSAARAGARPALVAAILLHAAPLAVVLSVGLRSPAEPLPLEAVPLVFEPPAPQASADSPPAPAAPAVPTPAAAPTPPPPDAAAPAPPPPTPDTPAPDLPAPDQPEPTVPTPQAATPETLTAVPPAVPPAPLPQLALPAIPPPPPGPGPAPEAEAPLPLPPAEPEAAPRHTAARPTPRPPSRHRPESHVEARAEDRPAAAAPPSETAPAAAAPAAPPGPVTPPRAVAGLAGNRRPVYPTQARDRGEEGTVLVLVQVTAQGAAASVSVARSSGHPALDEAALTAIRSWKFSPATRGGVPVAAEAEVPVAFHLND